MRTRPLFDRAWSSLVAASRRDAAASGLWLAVTLSVALLCAVAMTVRGTIIPFSIPDDARQFLFWMADWRDSSLFQGDLLAEYWRSVSPWLFRAVYRVFDLAGIEPITTARLLPLVLVPATAYFAFRFVRTIAKDAFVACVGALAVLLFLVLEDTIVSATPRAFAPLFFLIFLDGFARRSPLPVAGAFLCLAGVYPHLAIVGVTVLVLSTVELRGGLAGRPMIDLSWPTLRMVGAGTVAAIVGVIPFVLDSNRFGPVVTPRLALQFPTFFPGGRVRLFQPDGSIDFACGPSTSFVPDFPGRSYLPLCTGYASPVFWLVVAILVAGPIILLVRRIRSSGREGSAIPFLVVVSSVVWFLIAVLVAFKLHEPNRFSIMTIPIVAAASIGILAGEAARDRLLVANSNGNAGRAGILLVGVCALVVAYGFALFVTLSKYYDTWHQSRLAAALSATPPQTMIAGFTNDVDFIPALARRRILFSFEHAIPYHLGYYRQIEARMRDMVEVELSPDPSVLAKLLTANGVDIYLVDAERLTTRTIPKRYAGMLGDFVDKAAGDAQRQTALARLAPGCTLGSFDRVLELDARCLVRAASSESG